jgi:hypothetical protein
MAGTIFPSSKAQLLAWATNYKTKIPEYVVTLNMTPEQAAEEISWCNDFITAIFEVTTQKKHL